MGIGVKVLIKDLDRGKKIEREELRKSNLNENMKCKGG